MSEGVGCPVESYTLAASTFSYAKNVDCMITNTISRKTHLHYVQYATHVTFPKCNKSCVPVFRNWNAVTSKTRLHKKNTFLPLPHVVYTDVRQQDL